MSVLDDTPRSYSGALMALVAISLLAGAGSLIWNYSQSRTITNQQNQIDALHEQDKKLASELRETNAREKVDSEELGQSLNITQTEMDKRARRLSAARRPTRSTASGWPMRRSRPRSRLAPFPAKSRM